MAQKRTTKEEMRTIVLVDAVNFSEELKRHGKSVVDPKIRQLLEYVEFFFVFKLKGEIIAKMGDGFLILCSPRPIEVINEAVACQAFIAAYNHGKVAPQTLNVRIAIHYGLISPPDSGNYVDTNLNLAARLEGVTPPNSICISSVLHGIVADTLRGHEFEKAESNLKGLGQNEYYVLKSFPATAADPTKQEARLGFYFSILDALRDAENWEAVRDTCEQALADFPDHPEFTSQLAFSLLILEEYVQSIRYYEKCVEMDYEVADALFFVGCSHRNLGNVSRALEILQKAIDIEENHFHAMLELAEIYLDRREYETAAHWAKRAASFAPRYADPRAVQIAIALIREDPSLADIVKAIPAEVRTKPEFKNKVQLYLPTQNDRTTLEKLGLALGEAEESLRN